MECDIIIVPYSRRFLHIERTGNANGIIEALLLKKDGYTNDDPHQAPYGNSTFQIHRWQDPFESCIPDLAAAASL
jgi:hypothetical protein